MKHSKRTISWEALTAILMTVTAFTLGLFVGAITVLLALYERLS